MKLQFLQPSFLLLALLILVPVVLYLFRRKSRTVRVPTLVFFQSMIKEHREMSWLHHLKRILSLLLTVAVLLFLTGALARMVFSPGIGQVRSVILVVDTSASMAARGEGGQTRLEEAVQDAVRRVQSLPDGITLALYQTDSRLRLLVPLTKNKREILRVLGEIEVRPMGGRETLALAEASRLAGLEKPGEVWWFGDGAEEAGLVGAENHSGGEQPDAAYDSGEDSVAVKRFSFALPQPWNAGITAFQVRPVPLTASRYEIFVQLSVAGASSDSVPVEWEARVAGQPVQFRQVDVRPGTPVSFVIPLEGAEGQLLEVEVTTPGDCLKWDDKASLELPKPRPLLVAWWPGEIEDPFLELALRSLAEDGKVEIVRGSRAQWPPVDLPDVNVFDGWLPPAWDARVPAIVMNPPSSDAMPVPYLRIKGGGLSRETIRAVEEDHPVLFRVATPRVTLTQTGVLEAGTALQPLWLADDQTVMAAGEKQGQRLVIMAFSPRESLGLPLTGAFPVLLGNALFWCGETRLAAAPEALVQATGELRDWKSGRVTWKTRKESGDVVPESLEMPPGLSELDRVGLWSTGNGAGERGSSLLLSEKETRLPGVPTNPEAEGSSTTWFTWIGGDGVPWLLGLAIVVLVLESWLYHRRGVA
jgi:hypothetical protein